MKRSRLVALLLTLAVVLAAAPAMGAVGWGQAPVKSYPVSTDIPKAISIDQLENAFGANDLKASRKAGVTAAVAKQDSYLRVKGTVVNAYLAGRASPIQKPAVFSIRCVSADKKTSGDLARTFVLMHPLDPGFAGKKPSDLKIVKVFSETTWNEYDIAYSYENLVNGKFLVVNSADAPVAHDGTITEGKVIICLEVSGDFDVGSGDFVIDPVFFVAPTGGTPSPITGVTVTPASKVVAKGGTAQLTASVLPAGSTQTVTWDSNKTPAVRVSATGLVTVSADAVLGTVATITATSTVDTTKKGTSTITVGTPVTGVSVAPTSATISAGGTVQLTATLVPANPTISTVTWTSSNTAVATVGNAASNAGLVTGVAAGSATITCTTTDGGFTAKSTITVTATPTPPGPEPEPEPGPVPVPVPVPDLPGAIEKPDVEMPSSTSGLPGAYTDLVSSYGGRLVLKSSIIDDISDSIEAASGVSLPVFSGSVSAAGKSAAFAFGLDESGLVGQPVSSLRLVKVKSASSHLEFSRVSKISDLADGKFVIVTSAGVIREANDTVRSTDVLVLVIKDNGAFDMDRTPAVILDPCFLAQSTRRAGGGGGGCTAGAFAPMALLLAAPLLLLLKK